MTAHPALLARPRTWADLDAMPDDGNRYELVEGQLIVSPAPDADHQDYVGGILALLRETCRRTRQLRAFCAPFDVRPVEGTGLQPDVVVVDERDLEGGRLRLGAVPVLAVEVLSASNRADDLGRKATAYARMGVRWYWVLDPERRELFIQEREDDDRYRVMGSARADDVLTLDAPLPLAFSVADLEFHRDRGQKR